MAKKDEYLVTTDWLTEEGAKEWIIRIFNNLFPGGSSPVSQLLQKLEELATINHRGVAFAKWLLCSSNLPKSKGTLDLGTVHRSEKSYVFYNGDVSILTGCINNGCLIINGNLKTEWIALSGDSELITKEVNAVTLYLYGKSIIDAKEVNAGNSFLYGKSRIRVNKLNADAVYLYKLSRIKTYEANVHVVSLDDDSRFVATNEVITHVVCLYDMSGIAAKEVYAHMAYLHDKSDILAVKVKTNKLYLYDKTGISVKHEVISDIISFYNESKIDGCYDAKKIIYAE